VTGRSDNSIEQTYDVNKLKQIKARVNRYHIRGMGTSNKKAIKAQLELHKNPIISAIKRTVASVGKGKLSKEHYFQMLPINICLLLDPVMQEKVWLDLENEKGPVESRVNYPFHQFMYDACIMQKGLQSIAVKTLMQLTNGLNRHRRKPYAAMMTKMIGLAPPPLRLDEIQVVLRAHLFFKMVQQDWIHRTKANHPTFTLTRDNEHNLERGGDCLIFDIIEELQKAFSNNKEIRERLLTAIVPDIFG
jgi:hypothetical protein